MENAATWAAVSSKAQDKADRNSLEEQDRATEEYCKRLGFSIHARLVSRESRSSVSANPLFESTNPAYIDLIELCQSKEIEHFIVDRDDRIARDYLLAEQVYRTCLNNGVAVHVVSSGVITKDMASDPLARLITAYSANQTIRAASRAMMRGRINRVKNGFFPQGLTYGYDEEFNSKREWVRYVGIDHELEIVRQAFELYMTNMGIAPIAEKLNVGHGQIRGIIGNVWLYAGYTFMHLGRDRARRQAYLLPLRKNPNVIMAKGHHYDIAILSEEDAQQIETEIIRRGKNKSFARGKHVYSSMIKCSRCGLAMGANYYNNRKGVLYRCRDRACEHYGKTVNQQKVTKAVITELKRHRAQLNALDVDEPQNDGNMAIERRISSVEASIKAEDAKLLNIARRFAQTGDDSLLDVVKGEIEDRKQALENELEELRNYEPPSTPQERYDIAETIIELFEDGPAAEINHIIKDLFHITYNPKTKDVSIDIDM